MPDSNGQEPEKEVPELTQEQLDEAIEAFNQAGVKMLQACIFIEESLKEVANHALKLAESLKGFKQSVIRGDGDESAE